MTVTLKQRIVALDKVSGDKFGYTVVKRSNWMAIGNHPVNGGISDPSDGAVYMYENVAGTWTYRQKIIIIDSTGDGQYPWYLSTKLCVALSQTNNWLSIGATNKVFLYHLESGTWTLKQTIDEPTAFFDHFGFSVAMTDYLLIVGQPVTWSSGYAYAYTFDGSTWSLQETIVNPTGVHYSDLYFYGWSVAIDESSISGDPILGNARVVVSNPCLVSGTPQGVNDIWVWKRDSGVWTNTTKIEDLHSTGNGWAVTTDQDTLLALNIDYNGGTYSELRSFIRDSGFETYSFWQDLSTTILTHDVEGQYLLSTSGGYLIASNCLNTVSGNNGAGSINVFSSTPSVGLGLTWSDAYSLLPPNVGTNYNFGWATSLDSYSFAVSAINEVDDGTTSGAVYVFEISNTPVADFISDITSGTKPLSVSFTDDSTNSPTSWLWNFGDGNTSTDQNPTNIYLNSGVYSVSLKATNAYGEDTETKTDYIEVFGLSPIADFTSDVTSGADSLTVNFTDLSTNSPTSWLWDFGDGNTSASQNPTHSYSSAGHFTVTLTATNGDGSNTDIKSNYIFVGKANFSASPLSGYANLTVQFTDLSIFKDPTSITIKTWLWNFGDGGTSTEQNPTHIYTTPGKYSVTLTITET